MSRLDAKKLTRLLAGLSVSHVSGRADGAIVMTFTNGSMLTIERTDDAVTASFAERAVRQGLTASANQPTRRQREYLEFIRKYMGRFGVAPAESDIQRHFLVSAPSVNQMMRSLEQRGFIARQRDLFTGQAMPRSIRILVDGL